VPTLPTTSDNGYSGTWSPSVVSNTASGTYTFTPSNTPQECITTATFAVTVNQIVTPAFSFGTTQALCSGSAAPTLPLTSTNNITGTWNQSVVSNTASGTYTFTPNAGQCATTTTLTVTVNPIPTATVRTDTTVYDGAIIPITNFTGTPSGVIYNWTNNNTAIGLAASGTGNVPSFTAVNRGNTPVTATITVTPSANNCSGTARVYIITVLPLNKDVFVPNVFSPNGDGKNDLLFVYGNYIDKLEMRIFNQWGEQVAMINSRTQGWNGTHRNKPQPIGVYVYALRAVLSDGRTVQLKGSITLLR
jgi:gliding motility-associated-like protein